MNIRLNRLAISDVLTMGVKLESKLARRRETGVNAPAR